MNASGWERMHLKVAKTKSTFLVQKGVFYPSFSDVPLQVESLECGPSVRGWQIYIGWSHVFGRMAGCASALLSRILKGA